MWDPCAEFNEAVALEMEDITRLDALQFAICYLATAQWGEEENIEAEAARRLLIVMRNELIGGKHGDNRGRQEVGQDNEADSA